MCQLFVTDLVRPPRKRFGKKPLMNPAGVNWPEVKSGSNRCCELLSRMFTLKFTPIRSKKSSDRLMKRTSTATS